MAAKKKPSGKRKSGSKGAAALQKLTFEKPEVISPTAFASGEMSANLSTDSTMLSLVFPLKLELQMQGATSAALDFHLKVPVGSAGTAKQVSYQCTLRGNVLKASGARAVILVDFASKTEAIEFAVGKKLDNKPFTRIVKHTGKNLGTPGQDYILLTLVLSVERKTEVDYVMLYVDSADISGIAQ